MKAAKNELVSVSVPVIALSIFWNGAQVAEAQNSAVAQTRNDAPAEPACRVKEIRRIPDGLRIPSPDGGQYLVSKKDPQGIYQIYVGRVGSNDPECISSTERTGGPKPNRHKMQALWHPSGRWIFTAVEWDEEAKPFFGRRNFPDKGKLGEGMVQCGIWTNIYATTPDGGKWYRLSDFGPAPKPGGFTGVAFTPDGKKGVWAQIVDGNVFKYTFGKWELMMADFRVDGHGVPSFVNPRNISPAGANWLEPGNFSPDGKSLLISSDIGFPDPAHVEGMDQYVLDVSTGKAVNLTNSQGIWDEHGVFSPDGKKVLFMSSQPYRDDPKAHKILGLKTEFMLMNRDGSGLEQLTHFNQPGHPESSQHGSVAANGIWSRDGSSIDVLNLLFPDYETWTIRFDGRCGAK